MSKEPEFEDITELSADDALDQIKQMVAYIIEETDQELIDNYSDTFMLICNLYKSHACKEQREICANRVPGGFITVSRDLASKIRNAPEPK